MINHCVHSSEVPGRPGRVAKRCNSGEAGTALPGLEFLGGRGRGKIQSLRLTVDAWQGPRARAMGCLSTRQAGGIWNATRRRGNVVQWHPRPLVGCSLYPPFETFPRPVCRDGRCDDFAEGREGLPQYSVGVPPPLDDGGSLCSSTSVAEREERTTSDWGNSGKHLLCARFPAPWEGQILQNCRGDARLGPAASPCRPDSPVPGVPAAP